MNASEQKPSGPAPQLIILFGPPAVGKMSVGQALAEQTGFKLFHNHMSIEAVLPIFEFGSSAFRRLVYRFRQDIFQEVARSDLPGLIFTWVWAFEHPGDKEYIDSVRDIFRAQGGECFFVGLEAPLDVLLERNQSPERLKQKPSKRRLKASEHNLRQSVSQHQLEAPEPFYYPEHFLRLQNQNLTASEAALKIVQHFQGRLELRRQG